MSHLKRTAAVITAACLLGAGAAWAEPEYVTIKMEIEVAKPAADVWAKVGGYCDLGTWIAPPPRTVPCSVTSGDGGIGTVRSIANGAVIEVLTAQTPLSYGYTQPAREGQFYNLYHGFMEARPVTASSSPTSSTPVTSARRASSIDSMHWDSRAGSSSAPAQSRMPSAPTTTPAPARLSAAPATLTSPR